MLNGITSACSTQAVDMTRNAPPRRPNRRSRRRRPPPLDRARRDAGIILGSGLGDLADEIDAEATIDYADIPHFPRTTAIGHAGKLVCGTLDGVPVVAFQGRFHLYEGHSRRARRLARATAQGPRRRARSSSPTPPAD